MDIEDVRKIASEEMTKAIMNNIDSSLIFSYVKGLEEKLDKKDKIINAMAVFIDRNGIYMGMKCRDDVINYFTKKVEKDENTN